MRPGSRYHRELEADYAERLASWSDIAEQMPLLRDAAAGYDRPAVAELGTRSGNSTAALLAGASASGGHVHSVDSGPAGVPAWWRETGAWSFLAADDMSELAGAFIPAILDVLFIDTSHTYEHTLAELRRYVPRVRPGGVVLCHDTEMTRDSPVMGPQWAAAAAMGPLYPVAAALDQFCAETGLAWSRQDERPAPRPGPFYGLGTIRVPGET